MYNTQNSLSLHTLRKMDANLKIKCLSMNVCAYISFLSALLKKIKKRNTGFHSLCFLSNLLSSLFISHMCPVISQWHGWDPAPKCEQSGASPMKTSNYIWQVIYFPFFFFYWTLPACNVAWLSFFFFFYDYMCFLRSLFDFTKLPRLNYIHGQKKCSFVIIWQNKMSLRKKNVGTKEISKTGTHHLLEVILELHYSFTWSFVWSKYFL